MEKAIVSNIMLKKLNVLFLMNPPRLSFMIGAGFVYERYFV